MKKFFGILMAVAIAAVMVGCNGGAETETPPDTTQPVDTTEPM